MAKINLNGIIFDTITDAELLDTIFNSPQGEEAQPKED